MAKRLPHNVKLFLDFGPLLGFFIGYKLAGLSGATVVLIAATVISLAVIYAVERKIALAPLISGLLVATLGGLTLLFNDERFIKIKPTLVNGAFAIILLAGVYGFKRGLLKYVLDMAFHLTEQGWLILSRRWGFYFLALAGLNEVVWRSFSTEAWVNFKVFGLFGLTIIFALAQMRLIQRYRAGD